MEATEELSGKAIQSISCPESTSGLRQIPWLRLVLGNGAKFEFEPIEKAIKGEKYPALGLKLEFVKAFSQISEWPGGPALKWREMPELRVLRNIPINTVEYSDPAQEGITSAINIAFKTGAWLKVTHSSSPMAIDVEHGLARNT